MADKSIGELPVSQAMTDDALLVVYQDGQTESIEGQLIKGYARESVKQYVEGAEASASAAAESASAAQTARTGVETYAAQAGESAAQAAGAAEAAEGAKTEAETAKGVAQTAQAGAEAAQGASERAKSAAETSLEKTEAAREGAGVSAAAAADSATAAETSAATAAEGAQTAAAKAEEAAGSAAGARTAETGAKASETAAGTSADAAEQARQAIESLSVSGDTLAAGSQVTVSKAVGPEGNVFLTFGIPQGEQGVRGPKGDRGETGPQGAKGETGAQGPKGDMGATGPQGVSITSIKRTGGNGAAGTTDTYTVSLSNGATSTFQVYNGRDGEGAGDMTAATYDPTGRAQDVFGYVDAAKQAAMDASRPADWVPTANEVAFTDGQNFQQKYDAGALTGPPGAEGAQGGKGDKGDTGPQGVQGPKGETGLIGLKGDKGDTGAKGAAGPTGAAGKSAYQQAVEAGYTGTEAALNQALDFVGNRSNDLICADGAGTTTPAVPLVTSSAVAAIWAGTQAQYDAIATKDNTTLYLITEEGQ